LTNDFLFALFFLLFFCLLVQYNSYAHLCINVDKLFFVFAWVKCVFLSYFWLLHAILIGKKKDKERNTWKFCSMGKQFFSLKRIWNYTFCYIDPRMLRNGCLCTYRKLASSLGQKMIEISAGNVFSESTILWIILKYLKNCIWK
jgi:hypothetical protein